ncbi:MAG TPA: PDZ domain-containing protein [Mycobacteriales bacterium]|nr:PDZ domain-containing protein [Mycobacteriales bacterium]
MTRRGMTLAVSTALLFALAVVAGAVKVPYVALTPGPVVNTLGVTKGDQRIIQVTGRQTYPPSGRLDLTTVSVRGAPGYGQLSLVEALRYWVDPEVAVVPREAYYPPGKDPEVTEAESTAQMVDSQESAALAALRLLGEKVTSHVAVVRIVEGGPSAGRLKPEDVVDSVDGQPVASAGDLRAAVVKRRPGDPVQLGVTRAGARTTVTVTTGADPDDKDRAIIGVELAERCPCKTPYQVKIGLADDIGGPSAGLMFALAIVDTVTPGELTGGVHVAGTGGIDPGGFVEPIGGIRQKLHGARNKGADHFLVPAGNWDEAQRDPPRRLQLHRVETLADAVGVLCGIGKATGQPCSK